MGTQAAGRWAPGKETSPECLLEMRALTMKPAPASASRSSLASCGKVGALPGSPLVISLFKGAGLGCEWVFQMGLWISQQKTWLTSWKSPAGGGRFREWRWGRKHQWQKAVIYRSCNLRKRPSSRCEHLIWEQGRILQGKGNISPCKVCLIDFRHVQSKGNPRHS